MNRQQVLDRLGVHSQEIRQRFGVARLAIFGSIARDEAGPGSDIDVLVEFDGRADFNRFMDLKFYLEDLLGARVDLVTKKGLRERLLPFIEEDALDVA